jgi:hypothetical protein
MRRNPERLAWTVLLVSLFTCVTLAVIVPLAIRSFFNDSTETPRITLEVQQGTALVRLPGSNEPIGVTTSRDNLPEGTTIRADDNVQAVLTVRSPLDNSILQTVQIYGSTNLDVALARSPRFQVSTQPYQVTANVEGGRVRVNVVGNSRRAFDSNVITPQADTELQEGSYAFEVSNDETQVTVREGLAQVSGQGTVLPLVLNPQQRTVVQLGSPPSGIYKPERDLIVNGNFRLPLEGTWEPFNDLQNRNELSGTVTIQTIGGQRSAVFDREGEYHAATGIRQAINKDVRDLQALKLSFVVRVFDQNVPLCGAVGSECPIMMQLDYKDADGTDRSFLQGFYARPDDSGVNPDYNTTSGSRQKHLRISPNVAYTYESDNLIDSLKPSQITAITFYASGHTYRSSVAQVELLGNQ